ncbi:uncharacterized protein Z518_09408 [Rhinocladiella mackenziei CBS 650.93]|uniref:Uncharacterized protein n=1 Tax=Rhinocladiella mackenziei CBS 650.93 TaxID=1442369 RepID=A0A0D2FI45_9EURO|nr:uncharacterized protein Z518_09408 [Rhinocladiella mackenziei CBS 650.93]KIX01682.1 hypothetical protein Z518_09408 [Rhinocladiella mackenziei CBS 650.93]
MSPSPLSHRRLKPEPLEATGRSSRRALSPSDHPSASSKSDKARPLNTDSMPPQTKPRRFLPQPVEESVRSSRKKNGEHIEGSPARGGFLETAGINAHYSYSDDPVFPGVPNSRPSTTPRHFTPEPVETSTRTSRRKFAPEPIETSTRKNKDQNTAQENEASSKPRRKFAPEPVETTTRSSKDKEPPDAEEIPTTRPRRKFAPEPIETTTTTRRRRKPDPEDADEEPPLPADSTASSRTSSGPRKFSPELLETAKGSYRRVHLPPPEVKSPSPSLAQPSPSAPAGEEEVADEVGGLEESKFSAAALARKHPDATRQHSFIVPDLPMIESTTEDESSDAPSLSDSPPSVEANNKKDNNRPGAKDSYTEYVLRLAAETVTEKELQEQAMAAYINERPHEPVDHFAISHDEDEDGPLPAPMFQGEKGVDIRTFRRSSAAELDLELQNMRRHHEQLEQAKRELKADTAGPSRFSAVALATRHALEAKGVKKTKKPRGPDEDSELARMRAAASPPMLGDNLIFPFTISPKMTRCDPDQPPRPRNVDGDDESKNSGGPVLWKSEAKPKNDAGGGLWMGMCQAGMWQPRGPENGLRSGIQTPAPQTPASEKTNPFESTTPGRDGQTPGRRRPYSGISLVPLTPPRSQDGEDVFTSMIDKKLHLEKKIEDEFPARVITQIYNYLSLGYPSLAHMFDEELSKISRIPLEELRKDDYNVDAKGYVGAPEGDGCDESEVIGKCKRWEALRLYVREWARQSPNFADDQRRVKLGANEDWGARARKGSWGH